MKIVQPRKFVKYNRVMSPASSREVILLMLVCENVSHLYLSLIGYYRLGPKYIFIFFFYNEASLLEALLMTS